ncbi:MAG: SNF2 helicase associated domain-containing protein, partial [Clostridia bacterium]
DSTDFAAGREIYLRGGVHECARDSEALQCRIDGLIGQTVRVQLCDPPEVQCGCTYARGGMPCRHMIAALLYTHGSGLICELSRRRAQEAAADLLQAFEPVLLQDAQLKMEITLHLSLQALQPQLHIALRMGQDRMYVVRSLPQFLRAMESGETITFGKGFVLEPRWMSFDRVDMQVLGILREIESAQWPCEQQGYRAPQEGKFLPLPAPQAARILRLLRARSFRMAYLGEIDAQESVECFHLSMRFHLRGAGRSLLLEAELPADLQPLTPDCEFVRCEGRAVQLSLTQRQVVRVLLPHLREGRALFRFDDADTERMVSELLPRLELAGSVEMESGIRRRMIRMPLRVQLYLDRDGAEVTVRTVFHYGDTQIDPFAPQAEKGLQPELPPPLLMRDAAGERAVLDELARAGFKVRAGRVYLSNAR